MEYPNYDLETIIIFGCYERYDISIKSLKSLLKSIKNFRVKIIISDSSSNPMKQKDITLSNQIDYIWTPGKVSMAHARNLAVEYARNKYVSDWIIFVEDDIEYQTDWYNKIIDVAKNYYGKKSPHGLSYGIFTASPLGIKNDENTITLENGYTTSMFGPRADQRLFKMSHYLTISREWESDLLGISSAQTGKVINRSAMRGYCVLSIGNLNLCSFIDEEESTWVGLRDIGPAAFDKRIEGYKSIIKIAQSSYSEENINYEPKPSTNIPMTSIKFDEKMPTIFELLSKRIIKKIKSLINKL